MYGKNGKDPFELRHLNFAKNPLNSAAGHLRGRTHRTPRPRPLARRTSSRAANPHGRTHRTPRSRPAAPSSAAAHLHGRTQRLTGTVTDEHRCERTERPRESDCARYSSPTRSPRARQQKRSKAWKPPENAKASGERPRVALGPTALSAGGKTTEPCVWLARRAQSKRRHAPPDRRERHPICSRRGRLLLPWERCRRRPGP